MLNKNKLLLGLLLLLSGRPLIAQQYSTYYDQRATLFSSLSSAPGKIIFCGNSITDGGEWSELFNDARIINRGISGDISQGVLDRAGEMIRQHPSKLFLLIGVNDLSRGIAVEKIAANIAAFTYRFKIESPATRIYIQTVLPVNPQFNKFATHVNKTDSILKLNSLLAGIAHQYQAVFVDLFTAFAGADHYMDPIYTNDGLHLLGPGYMKWKSVVFPHVYDLGERPSLLPAPQQLEWKKIPFPLYEPISLQSDGVFSSQLSALEKLLQEKGLRFSRQAGIAKKIIRLQYKKMPAGYLSAEAYELSVDSSVVTLSAQSGQGIFYALQTLRQLMRDGVSIPGCSIQDKPAFAWRGIMHDVGRNYQSIDFLKQQIDIMSRYKLNIFHFHLTEDIAWRLQSKLYPQLTAPANMLRNPGEYYTLEEVKDLVQYCKERFITLVPEVDMPGHSAAFKRAMKTDMQSAEGLAICKNILTELCRELDIPYLHIGGDEVKITNPGFLPSVAQVVSNLGKKVVAWDPGGNVPPGTILQMWEGNVKVKPGAPVLDSRHLYANHHDPIDGVVSTFNHEICDVQKGDSTHLGAIVCIWPDRRVAREEDITAMNPVFPEMLSLAERSWRGGGWKNYISDIGHPGSGRYSAFTEFESRLLDQKKQYFCSLPFPYVRHSDIHWKLIGPFDNQGRTDAVFYPENLRQWDTVSLSRFPSVYGGTIFLRHFWSPVIGSHLASPKENSTYYAIAKIYSEREQCIGLWAGFYNISRSNNTATPAAGTWDNRNSRLWLNGKEIAPPRWKYPGRKNTDMETPLADEGYEYRVPSKVVLHQGWNTILIKSPVASFKSGDWQSPVKWMFSCMPILQHGINADNVPGIRFD